jgi:GGDEF domain-containing protein
MARSMARNGMAVHIALLTVTEETVLKNAPRRQQEIMKNLQEQIRVSLRRGDAAAQCSTSQYILLLPQANYENSCMVCERIIKAFLRKYPHCEVDIQYAVYPVKPEDEMT